MWPSGLHAAISAGRITGLSAARLWVACGGGRADSDGGSLQGRAQDFGAFADRPARHDRAIMAPDSKVFALALLLLLLARPGVAIFGWGKEPDDPATRPLTAFSEFANACSEATHARNWHVTPQSAGAVGGAARRPHLPVLLPLCRRHCRAHGPGPHVPARQLWQLDSCPAREVAPFLPLSHHVASPLVSVTVSVKEPPRPAPPPPSGHHAPSAPRGGRPCVCRLLHHLWCGCFYTQAWRSEMEEELVAATVARIGLLACVCLSAHMLSPAPRRSRRLGHPHRPGALPAALCVRLPGARRTGRGLGRALRQFDRRGPGRGERALEHGINFPKQKCRNKLSLLPPLFPPTQPQHRRCRNLSMARTPA